LKHTAFIEHTWLCFSLFGQTYANSVHKKRQEANKYMTNHGDILIEWFVCPEEFSFNSYSLCDLSIDLSFLTKLTQVLENRNDHYEYDLSDFQTKLLRELIHSHSHCSQCLG